MMTRQEGTTLEPGHTHVPTAKPASAPSRTHLAGDCQTVGSILSRIGDKWTVLTVLMLAGGPRRFNELKRSTGTISQRMLTLTLRGLERDGLVFRTVYPTIPPKVEYALTQLGHSLREPIESLGQWAFAHIEVVKKARSEFDNRAGP